MDALFGVIGLMGFIIFLGVLVFFSIKKKPKKVPLIGLAVCFVLLVAGLSMDSTPTTDTTAETKGTTKEEVKEETPEEKQAREEAEAIAEEAAKVAEKAEWDNFVKENSKKLSAGNHTVPDQIQPGRYDITFNGSGNFFVYNGGGELMTNEIGGSSGLSKYRTTFLDGDKIELSGVSINAKPIKSVLKPYEKVELYAGYWFAGQDVTAGRYKVTPGSGSGNFFIYGSNGSVKTNEILGSDFGVEGVIINLEDGDIINIASLNKVTFTPED